MNNHYIYSSVNSISVCIHMISNQIKISNILSQRTFPHLTFINRPFYLVRSPCKWNYKICSTLFFIPIKRFRDSQLAEAFNKLLLCSMFKYSWLIYLSYIGILGCFQFGTIIYKILMNIIP
jgi:hypothetical protein